MRTLLSLVVGLTLLGAGDARAQSAASSARGARMSRTADAAAKIKGAALVNYSGEVELLRKGAKSFEVVRKAPLPLGEGDSVAAAGGEARVRLLDGSEIHLEAGGRVTLGEQSSDRITIRLVAGKVWAKVVKLKGRRFEVRSESSVASVRGTEFSMSVLGRRASVTEVVEGRVSVRALLEDRPVGAERMLGAGQSVRVSGGRIGEIEGLRGMIEAPARATDRAASNSRVSSIGGSPAELRAALAREVGQQLGAEAVQKAAASSSAASQSSEAGARLSASSGRGTPIGDRSGYEGARTEGTSIFSEPTGVSTLSAESGGTLGAMRTLEEQRSIETETTGTISTIDPTCRTCPTLR